MKKYEIKEAIDAMRNKIDNWSSERLASRLLIDSIHTGTVMERDGGVVVNEDLDFVLVAVPKTQYKKDGTSYTISLTRTCDYIITTKAPTLPIPNGIYRGRNKNGKFTMIAYFDSIMVDIGCAHRGEIRVIDSFWIDLRSIKVEEYKSPRQLRREEESKTRDDVLELTAKLLTANSRVSDLEEENRRLKKELELIKRDGLHVNDPSFDEFANEALTDD